MRHPSVGHVVTPHSGIGHASRVFSSGHAHSGVAHATPRSFGGGHFSSGSGGHHFDAAHWTRGHFGDLHHFGGVHHGAHGFLGHHHHDFHFYPFFSLGFYGWSYPYYYSSPYYDYYPYASYTAYGPSYYEVPVYSSTNYLSTNAPAGVGAINSGARTPAGTSVASERRYPDVFMPRIELPSREAPEALPDEPAPSPAHDNVPPESQPNRLNK